jgi:hypothetical protein
MPVRGLSLLCVLTVALSASPALALDLKGHDYPPSAAIEGHELHLLGAGVRNKWMFDVYVLAAYTESGSCKPADIINRDEAKYLRLDMLRDVSADKMASTIGESFAEHMPKDASPELRAQHKAFLAYFKDELTKGTVLEFLYIPGSGTHIKQNGKKLGDTLSGPEFARVLWDIYFGADTCCGKLKGQVLDGCKR